MVQNQFTPSSTAISESNEPLLFGFFQKNQKKNLLGLPPRAQMSWKQSKKKTVLSYHHPQEHLR